jgi:MFS family permease
MPELRTPRRAVAATFLLSGALFGILAGRIPAFVDRFELSEDRLGLLLLCVAAGSVVSFPLAGHLSDRHGAAWVTQRTSAAALAVLVVLPLCPNVALLGLALVLFGSAQGSLDVAMNAWAAEVERHLGRPVMSSFHAMFSLGGGLGAATGFLAAGEGMGTGSHFLIAALMLGLPCLGLATITWASTRSSGGFVLAVPRGTLAVVGAIAFCAAIGEGAVADWSAVYLHGVKAMSEGQAALGYAAFSAAMVAARLAGDGAIRRFGPVQSARVGGLLAAAGMAIVIAGGGLAISLAGFACIGLGYAVIFPLAYSRAANDPHMPPGRAIAAVATLGYGGMLMGPPMVGFFASVTSLGHAFWLIALMALLIAALAGYLRPAAPAAKRQAATIS